MQTAVFVDAGYLFAQGSHLLTGSKIARSDLALNVTAAVLTLEKQSEHAAPGIRLLRIYWYDGLVRGGQPSAEQTALARSNNIKLRFGMVNSAGQQKGVDSLIVTDLIELARNHSISDALILAGDEDLRVGVQIAQTFGVRVHLVGIKPALGSQSPTLVAEADTHIEWGIETISELLLLKAADTSVPGARPTIPESMSPEAQMEIEVQERVGTLDNGFQVAAHVSTTQGNIPPELDRPALASLRNRMGRELTFAERKIFRDKLRSAIQLKFPS